MRYVLKIFLCLMPIWCLAQSKNEKAKPFVVQPYLQIGQHPVENAIGICWQANLDNVSWTIEWKATGSNKWMKSDTPTFKILSVSKFPSRKLYSATLTGLNPGSQFDYRISRNKEIVFTSNGHALKSAAQSFRCVVMGDIGAGTPDAKLISKQASLAAPDIVLVPGDIVYEHGLVSEYDANFWPVYNADETNDSGASLMRSVPFVGAPGNHDTEDRDFDKDPDALAYFMFWEQPVNGPAFNEGGPTYPALKISDSARKQFQNITGGRFPVMTNFSFNYGNAHWLVLDADNYVDWTNKGLLDWVEKDLGAASGSTWKFVVYHQPGFNSSREHYEQQQMRLLAPIFDSLHVDVVFNGHVHNYQRSYPMRFVPDRKGIQLIGGRDHITPRGRLVTGRWTLDKSYNGKENAKANGVIYIVTGAGGQELYNPDQTNDPDSWQKFTDKFVSTVHSLSVVDINGDTFTLKQVDVHGNTVDTFTIKKN